jgi:hypothetical protein
LSKLPAFQFYPGDWMKDPQVSMLTPQARGIWFDLICAMHENGRSGNVSGTSDQLARISRSNTSEFDAALEEFIVTKVADVTFCNKIVTVENRRMKRLYNELTSTKMRVKKYREKTKCNGIVTVASSSSSSTSVKNIIKKVKETGDKTPSFKTLTEDQFYKAIATWKDEYPKEMLRAFFDHWSEKDIKGKMKFQLGKTWDLSKRLNTWYQRSISFGAEKFIKGSLIENGKPKLSQREADDAEILRQVG